MMYQESLDNFYILAFYPMHRKNINTCKLPALYLMLSSLRYSPLLQHFVRVYNGFQLD